MAEVRDRFVCPADCDGVFEDVETLTAHVKTAHASAFEDELGEVPVLCWVREEQVGSYRQMIVRFVPRGPETVASLDDTWTCIDSDVDVDHDGKIMGLRVVWGQDRPAPDRDVPSDAFVAVDPSQPEG